MSHRRVRRIRKAGANWQCAKSPIWLLGEKIKNKMMGVGEVHFGKFVSFYRLR